MVRKQGTKGQKQIDKENKESLKFYRNVILTGLILFGCIRFVILKSSVYWIHYILSLAFGLVHYGAFNFLSGMADKGIDLNVQSGMAEHAKDIILLTTAVQILSLASGYFLALWLLIPCYAFYLLWVNILGPWFFAAPPEVDEKQMKKMERKGKRQYVYK